MSNLQSTSLTEEIYEADSDTYDGSGPMSGVQRVYTKVRLTTPENQLLAVSDQLSTLVAELAEVSVFCIALIVRRCSHGDRIDN